MKKTLSSLSLIAFCGAVFAANQAGAAITVTSYNITKNSITLSVTGNLPDIAPTHNANLITLVNTDFSGGYVFSQTGAFPAVSTHFSGPEHTFEAFAAGLQGAGDYVVGTLEIAPAGGASFNGTITAIWSSDIFNPTLPSNLVLYWGSDASNAVDSGVFLAAVPEPSTVALIGAGATALCVAAVRRRRAKA